MYKLTVAFLLVVLFIMPFVASADFAYLVKNSLGIDSHLIEEIEENGYSVDTIFEASLPTTDLSEYRMVIVGNQNLENPSLIPIDQHRTFIINSFDYYKRSSTDFQLGLSSQSGTKSSPTRLDVIDPESSIVSGVPMSFNAYTSAVTGVGTSYLKAQKPVGMQFIVDASLETDVALATVSPGMVYLNGKTAQERVLFFGMVYAEYWTEDTKKLFANSLYWVLEGEDRDVDEFFSDVDCNDNNADIYPGAPEIVYDGIDQNCDGVDEDDVDDDSFPSEVVGGADCDDFDPVINPNNEDIYNNCVNDAPIVSEIESQTYNETDTVIIVVEAIDAEEDSLTYIINDARFIQEENVFTWETNHVDAGVYNFKVNVSDGEFSTIINAHVEIVNQNVAPIFSEIPDIEWEEDTNLTLNLSEYFSDEDRELVFGIENTSDRREIILSSPASGIFIFSVEENWNGEDWIEFWASDLIEKTVSNRITLTVTPVNDAPHLEREIESIQISEESENDEILNLNHYFDDIDSEELSYTVDNDENVEIIINENIVSINAKDNFDGEAKIKFFASDGEFSTESNEVIVNITNIEEFPQFSELECLTDIEEDKEYNCVLNASDFENDELIFEIVDEENMNCIIDGNMLNYSSITDFSGEGSCEIVVSDNDGSDSATIEFNITAVNDMPIFEGEIENISWNEGDNFIHTLDLNSYFLDIDSELTFSVEGNKDIDVNIQEGLVSFSVVDADWNGEENIVFIANDGEFNVSSNQITLTVNDTGEKPIFNELNCLTNITEDEEYECLLSATDFENDTLEFFVNDDENMNCDIDDETLTYSSEENYNGEGSCEIVVSDNDGSSSLLLRFNISGVNDAPTINSYSPEKKSIHLLEGETKEFSVLTSDIDGNSITKRWFINEEETSNESILIFDNPIGTYNVSVTVSDDELNTTEEWNVVVGAISDFTCAEVGGNICTEEQICGGEALGVKDSNSCCAVSCMPAFSDADNCEILNDSIEIEITEPESDDEFNISSVIRAEVEIENNFNEEQDLEITAQIYDLDDDKAVGDEVDTEVTIDKNRKKSIRFDVIVPSDIELNNDNVLFVKVEDKICNQAYLELNLERSRHQVVINNFDIPNEVQCGKNIDVKIEAENTGKSDENVYIEVKSEGLEIDGKSDTFELEEAGGDDKDRKTLRFNIPEDANGEHILETTVHYGSLKAMASKTIRVECFEEMVNEDPKLESTSNTEEENTLSLNSVSSRGNVPQKSNLMMIIWILIIFLLVVSFILMFIAKRSRKLNKILDKEINPFDALIEKYGNGKVFKRGK